MAQALERRTHPSDQGSNFLEFHLYTDEDLEDHRRLGLRPYWSYLKGSFFAYEPAPVDGGVGICWEKESSDMDPSDTVGDLWPPVFLEAAVVCLGEPAGCGTRCPTFSCQALAECLKENSAECPKENSTLTNLDLLLTHICGCRRVLLADSDAFPGLVLSKCEQM